MAQARFDTGVNNINLRDRSLLRRIIILGSKVQSWKHLVIYFNPEGVHPNAAFRSGLAIREQAPFTRPDTGVPWLTRLVSLEASARDIQDGTLTRGGMKRGKIGRESRSKKGQERARSFWIYRSGAVESRRPVDFRPNPLHAGRIQDSSADWRNPLLRSDSPRSLLQLRVLFPSPAVFPRSRTSSQEEQKFAP